MTVLPVTPTQHNLSDQLAAVIAVLDHSPYEPNAAVALVLRRVHRELADRETLLLNLADVWRDVARRERQRAERERGARPYHEGYADGGAAAYEAAAAQIHEVLARGVMGVTKLRELSLAERMRAVMDYYANDDLVLALESLVNDIVELEERSRNPRAALDAWLEDVGLDGVTVHVKIEPDDYELQGAEAAERLCRMVAQAFGVSGEPYGIEHSEYPSVEIYDINNAAGVRVWVRVGYQRGEGDA